jgi:hypothetical protein
MDSHVCLLLQNEIVKIWNKMIERFTYRMTRFMRSPQISSSFAYWVIGMRSSRAQLAGDRLDQAMTR